MSERFRDVREEAEWLRCSEKSIRRRAAALGAFKIGARLVFPESATLDWLEGQGLGPRRGLESVKPAGQRAQRVRGRPLTGSGAS